jgi:pimeloyl-ACP methyl ester carboxylesterase
MANFLLIHGSCHGAWCWREVIPALNALGHSARAIDLPGHGADATPIAQVTLHSYAQAILDEITTPTILVGHSAAGYPISLAADLAPQKIARLIYLCAYVPAPGQSLADMRRAGPAQPLAGKIQLSSDRASYTIDPTHIRDLFYHDCPPGTLKYAMTRLCPQPVLPHETPLTLGPNYANTKRSYIRCTHDHTIPLAYQSSMTASWPASDRTEMPTGHSPFFADPSGLAHLLDQIALT